MPAFIIAALLAPAQASGQTTHIWIGRAAVDLLPEGELREILSRDELEPMLVHGCMFPDGGYPLNHPYAEAAHWEPFQRRYFDWIRENYGPPWSDEALQHVAFLLGLSCHGMADQVFDAHYQNRSQLYDGALGWSDGKSMDEATDVGWAALTGAQELPERWTPDETLVALFGDHGIEVDVETLEEGQALLELAVGLVGWLATNEETVAVYAEDFPWAMGHLEDEDVPGRPSDVAEVTARYYEELWARLNDAGAPREILRTWPADGGYKSTLDPSEPDARVTIAFAKPLIDAEVTGDRFEIVDGAGAAWPIPDPWVFYGDGSHLVHLVPEDPWAEDQDFTVTIKAGLPDLYGGALSEDYTFTFSTKPPAGEEEPASGCGCGPVGGPAGGCASLALAILAGWRRRR